MSLDNNNAVIKNGVITPKKIGNVKLTIEEDYSNIVKTYEVAIRNKVVLSESGYFILSGEAEFDAETNTILMTNGESARIALNFAGGSTLRKTYYSVDNNKICSIGTDGTITTLREGKTVIHMVVKDELVEHVSSSVNIKVTKKTFIQNMNEFLKRIRKTIGHFGAFVLLGLISTITYFLFFRNKLLPIGFALNYSAGFGVAALTEYIQTFTPQRAGLWSDVMLDWSGFLITALLITIIIIIATITKNIVKQFKEKQKENEDKE